jgi:tellurite resistance protein TerB
LPVLLRVYDLYSESLPETGVLVTYSLIQKENNMSGIIDNLISMFHLHSEKQQNRPFLEAAMAACAMVSASEGEVTFGDRIRVDKIMETLNRLKIFDPHEGIKLFNHYTDGILAAPKKGREDALTAIKTVTEDRDTAELLIDLCLAVSLSDGKTSLVEHIEIVSLCGLIGVDPDSIGLDTEKVLTRFMADN